MLQLEDYGFCKKGEGGAYVSDGTIRLGGRRPNNTSRSHLCEGYTHGIRRTAFSQLTVAFGAKRTSIDFGVRCIRCD